MLFATEVWAAEVAPLSWNWNYGAELYTLGGVTASGSSDFNLDNRAFNTPSYRGVLDSRFRSELSLANLKWIAQPRFEVRPEHIPHSFSAGENRTYRRFSFSQVYLEWKLLDEGSVSAGIQNFQWGPAEFLSPSNPLIHFNPEQRSLFWIDRGRGLAKANWTFGESWSAVALLEFFDYQKEVWREGDDSKVQGVLKLEYQESPNQYFGLSGGKGGDSKVWIGQYASLDLQNGFSVYADARETLGSDAYYPVESTGRIEMLQTRIDSSRVDALATAGFRFEGRVDFRFEFIVNSYGLSQTEFDSLLRAALRPGLESSESVLRALHPGLELSGKYYAYGSIRIPDLAPSDKLTFYARTIHSFMDHSGMALSSAEWILSDWALGVAEVSIPYGRRDSEFTLRQGIAAELGFKFAI